MWRTRTCRFYFCLLSCLGLFTVTETTQASFPLPPRFSANALASDYTIGQTDLLLPVRGDSAHNLYLDPAVAYGSDSQGIADLGVGYRWIHNEAAILGGYLFGGYSRIDNSARLWVANPGIEVLGSRWDAHLNGYVVMGDRNLRVDSFFGPVFYSGHSAFANVYDTDQHAGHGGDVQLGYQFFPQSSLKGYVGSYFFAPSHISHVWGGAAGLEYWIDSYLKVFASYTLDNVRHSTGALGIGVELGGTHVHRRNPSLEERMTDPVARYLSELGRGSVVPSRDTTGLRMDAGGVSGAELLDNNIAFFSQTGSPNNGGVDLTLANCTIQNPCGPTDFSQIGVDTLSSLLPRTIMYFSGGNYPAVNATETGAITLDVGQGVYSRTANFKQPAVGSARSIFNGAFNLSNNNSLNGIILLPTAAVHSPGVRVNNVGNVLITGSQIGSAGSPFAPLGVSFLGANSTGSISNSEIFALVPININVIAGTSRVIVSGNTLIANGNQATDINVNNATGTVDVTVLGSTLIANGDFATGITISNSAGTVDFTVADNSQITVTGDTATGVQLGEIGSTNQGKSTVILTDTRINGTGTGDTFGVYLINSLHSVLIGRNLGVNVVSTDDKDAHALVTGNFIMPSDPALQIKIDSGFLIVRGANVSEVVLVTRYDGSIQIDPAATVCIKNGIGLTCPAFTEA
jgi:hypothetical protein